MTSNRSDWSKLEPVAKSLKENKLTQVDVIALGSHMLDELGNTKTAVQRIFPDAYQVHTLVAGNTVTSMADSVGFGVVKLTTLLTLLHPDVVVIHGDRFDAFCTAIAANMLNMSIAHIEGGELSGTVDGTLRHAMTKLAHIHFACTNDAARRIRAMGEPPELVFNTGCPSYEKLFTISAQSFAEDELDSCFEGNKFEIRQKKYILALMHPVTNDTDENSQVFNCLLESLFHKKIPTVFFYPNIDPGNKSLIQILHRHQMRDPAWTSWLRVLTHVTPEIFLTMMKYASVMIGNSSAGIRETCVFGTPTLNLGTRQDGRRTPSNVTTLKSPTMSSIIDWIDVEAEKTYPPSFMYGRPDSARRIAHLLETVPLVPGNLKNFWEPMYSLLPPPSLQDVVQAHHPTISSATTPKVLGLITARGGSKGIPGKNIADINGKRLIEYTIEAAHASELLDRFILSTDCSEIAAVAEGCNCHVPFLRPAELSKDDSSHMQCILHALDRLRDDEGYEPDFVLILQPTSPFRTGEDIDACIRLVENTDCDLVMSVSESELSLSKNSYLSDEGALFPFAEITTDTTYIRRQELPKTYAENGAIYLQRTESLRSPPCHTPNFGSFRSTSAKGYVMPKERSLDIDTPFDLHMARLLMASPFNPNSFYLLVSGKSSLIINSPGVETETK